MRILVISDLPQFVTGGAEMQAYRLIDAWLEAGHDVIGVGRRMRDGTIKAPNGEFSVRRIRTIQTCGRAVRALTYSISLSVLLLRHRRHVDIIYARFLNEGAIVVAMLKRLRLLRQPLVAVPANTQGVGDTFALRALPGGRHVISLLSSGCDAINLIAGAMHAELISAGFNPERFTYIPNGIPVRAHKPRAPSLPPAFVIVGRLAHQKGIDILFAALSPLRERLQAGQFRFVGDGPEREALRQLANEYRISHAIVWLGELEQNDVANELAKADIFLLPSRYEGMSNAGLEAMERGKVMLLSRCGGLDEYITEAHGWVVEPEDIDGLTNCLSAALDATQDQLIKMGAACRDTVIRNFGMRDVGKRYESLFVKLLRMEIETDNGHG